MYVLLPEKDDGHPWFIFLFSLYKDTAGRESHFFQIQFLFIPSPSLVLSLIT